MLFPDLGGDPPFVLAGDPDFLKMSPFEEIPFVSGPGGGGGGGGGAGAPWNPFAIGIGGGAGAGGGIADPVEVASAGGGGGGDGGRYSVGTRAPRWFPAVAGTGGGGGRSTTPAPAVESKF